MKNILSIDLESWVYRFQDALRLKTHLDPFERRTQDNNYLPETTQKILDLLEKYSQKATFFVVAELYDWYPETIEQIEKKGHEIGYHTHSHNVLANSQILEKELQRSSRFIKRFNPVIFRAPQIFITKESLALLFSWGFKYSSSTYDEHIREIEGIKEIPISTMSYKRKKRITDNTGEFPKHLTLKLLFEKIPFGSGFFIALLGTKIFYFINLFNKNNKPVILFIHNWQLYIPKMIGSFSFKLKVLFRDPLSLVYTKNILKTLEKLLANYQFTTFRDFFYEQ